MTITSNPPARTTAPSAEPGRPAAPPEVSLAARQLRAIETFNRNLQQARAAAAATAHTRETRMDAARRMEVLRRQHEAVVARAHQHLQASRHLLTASSTPRVVLAHRSAWFVDRLAALLAERGLQVVARLDNGADAVGLTLCDQPELVLVEDTLAMVPGVEVVRELRALCPETRIVAQCAYGDRVGPLLEAGADAVYTRQVPPADVAAAMSDLFSQAAAAK